MKTNIIFAAIGGIAGFIIGKVVTEKKAEKRADEEIASVVESHRNLARKKAQEKRAEKEAKENDIPDEYYEEARHHEAERMRRNYSSTAKNPEKVNSNTIPDKNIEIIAPDSSYGIGIGFDEYEDEKGSYDKETLYYYEDGIVADTDNQVVLDVGKRIGFGSLNHIGEYEPDVVHVRNHERRTDFEILRRNCSFDEIKKKEQYYED